ncbi:hypothetical protein HDU93_003432 [Gonapodya sp. JEL0774]|nr:hypothetical protein HDU93_003432 [Gonapodya sp. JEL0774]
MAQSPATGSESYASETFLSSDLFGIKGKVALVTISALTQTNDPVFAQTLVCNGAKVYISSRNKQRIDATVAEINQVYGKVNGGQCIGQPLLERGSAGVDDPARVITVGSIEGVAGKGADKEGKVAPGYWATQAAIIQLTRNLALMLAKQFITVNCMVPGGIGHSDEAVKQQPTGKAATAEDLGGALLFLVSRASAHYLGTVIPVDGGSGLGNVNLPPSDIAIKQLDEEEARLGVKGRL